MNAIVVGTDGSAGAEAAMQKDSVTRDRILNRCNLAFYRNTGLYEKLFAYVTLVFYSKVLIWDKCFGWGTTDAVTGTVAEWAGYVMAFYFGKRGIENVARIVGNRFGR